jgi:hypothetical protein
VEFSDVIALIALLVSLGAAGMTFWFYWRQLSLIDTQEKLNRRLLERGETEAIEARQADVGARLIKLGSSKYRVKVFNRGKAAARNVRIEFPDGNYMISDQEIRDKFPMEELEQHDSVDLIAAIHMQTPRKQAVLLKWADDHSDSNEKTSYLTL